MQLSPMHQPCMHACDIGIVSMSALSSSPGGGDQPCWQSDIGIVSMSALSSSPWGGGGSTLLAE